MADDIKRSTRGVSTALLLSIVLSILYVLSVGPAFMMIGASGCNRTFMRVCYWVYAPIDFLPEPLENALQPWINLWDVYGVRRGGC